MTITKYSIKDCCKTIENKMYCLVNDKNIIFKIEDETQIKWIFNDELHDTIPFDEKDLTVL